MKMKEESWSGLAGSFLSLLQSQQEPTTNDTRLLDALHYQPKNDTANFHCTQTLHTRLIRRAWMRQKRLINYSTAVHGTVIIPACSAGLMTAAGAGSCGESRVKLWLPCCFCIAVDIFVLPSCSVPSNSQCRKNDANFFFSNQRTEHRSQNRPVYKTEVEIGNPWRFLHTACDCALNAKQVHTQLN